MADEPRNAEEALTSDAAEYQPPKIEEVLTRSQLEREVAYAGTIGGSGLFN